MADILEETHKEIKEAQGQIGAENKDLQELEMLFTRIKATPGEYKENKSTIMRHVNYAGRSESRAEREETKIKENLRKLAEEVPDEQKNKILDVVKEFKVAERTLIDESSRYAGKIRDKVKEAGIQAQLMETGNGKQAAFESAVNNAIVAVHKAVVYTGTMLAVLKKCDHIVAELKAMLVG